jgi:plasmid replication initiation protein
VHTIAAAEAGEAPLFWCYLRLGEVRWSFIGHDRTRHHQTLSSARFADPTSRSLFQRVVRCDRGRADTGSGVSQRATSPVRSVIEAGLVAEHPAGPHVTIAPRPASR